MARDLAALIQLMETGKLPEEYTHGMSPIGGINTLTDKRANTSSISIIENENVGTKSMQLFDTYDEINRQPKPSRYADMAQLMNMSMKAPQEYKDKMGLTEFTLKGLYSLIPERAVYAAAEGVNKMLAAGLNFVGMKSAASYFDKLAEGLKTPPVTKEYNEQIALLLADAKEKGKFQEATASLGYAVTEALAYLVRMGLVKSIPGVGAALPMMGGVGIPGKASQLFSGVGTLTDIKRHAAVLGGMGMLETPGDITGRMQGAVYRIAYNITPFIANATPFTGWGARATDTMLNMFLSSPSYVRAFQTSKDPGEFFVKAIPEFASDVIFALNTKGSPKNQRIAQMGKLPGFTKLSKDDRVAILDKVDKLSEPKVPYGEEIKPSKDKKVVLDTMKSNIRIDELNNKEKKINVGGTSSLFEQSYRRTQESKAPQTIKYQEANQERLIHSGDWKHLEMRNNLEGSGDIFRELTGGKWNDGSYMRGKINRIKDSLFNKYAKRTKGEVKDWLDQDRKNVDRLITFWEKQPIETPEQQWAKDLNIALAKGDLIKVRKYIKQFDNMEWSGMMMKLPGHQGLTRSPYKPKQITAGKQPGIMLSKSQVKKRAALDKKVIKDEKIDVLLRGMEKTGVVPKYVQDKVNNELNTWWAKANAGRMTYVMNNRLVENIVGMIDRYTPWGPNHKVLYQDINDAYSKELTGNHTKIEATKTFLQGLLEKKGINDAMTKRRQVGEFSLTDDDIMAIAYGSQDKGVLKHLMRGNGFTVKNIVECSNIVRSSPRMQAIINWAKERYKEAYGPLAQAYKAQTGKDLPNRPFFMHLVVDKENATFKVDNIAEQMMQRNAMGDHAYVTKNITKARVANPKQPINLGLIANYMKYTKEAEHYKAFAAPIKAMSDVLNDPRYKQALDKNMGKAAWKVLDKYMKDVAGTKTGADWNAVENSFNIIRRHTGIAMIGLNLLSGLRQPLSASQACAEIGLYHVLNGIGQIAKNPQKMMKFIYDRSAPTKYREGIFERFMAEEKQAEKVVTILTDKMTPHKAAMRLVTIMDKWTVLAVWKGTYDRVMTEGKTIDGDRIKNDDLERVAIMEADRVVRKTQPAASPKDLPGYHRGGPLARMFTMFQNQTNKNLNYFEYDIIGKYRAGKITASNVAYKVMFAYILPMMLLGMIARGRFPKTKKDVAEDMIKYPLSGAFMVGGLINSAINNYGSFLPAPLAGGQAGLQALTAFTKGDIEKTGKYGIQATAVLSGIPYNQLYRTWKGTLALMNGETDDWRRLIWSEYALTQGLSKKKPIRPYVYPRAKRKGR